MKLKPEEQIIFQVHLRSILLESETYCKLEEYIQHGQTTRLLHCIAVARLSYWAQCRLKIECDSRNLIRGALLHDFFLYDVKSERPEKHMRSHPSLALHNANSHFSLTDEEQDIIANHMWPLTISFPEYKSTFMVSLADKACAVFEFLHLQHRQSLIDAGLEAPSLHLVTRAAIRTRRILALAALMRP